MEWRDQGILLSSRRHGENSTIIDVFTPERGRHAGVVRGGASRKMAPVLQPGAQIDVIWRARLEDHLGAYQAELVRSRAALVMNDRMALSALNAVTALVQFCLPERETHTSLYQKTEQLLDLLGQPEIWALAYLKWELALLEEMGFGLDLSQCAVEGRSANDLSFISPRTGRAVSRRGAGEWADRLLPLPACLLGDSPETDAEIVEGLTVTGHFLMNSIAPEVGNKPLPEARIRFVDRYKNWISDS